MCVCVCVCVCVCEFSGPADSMVWSDSYPSDPVCMVVKDLFLVVLAAVWVTHGIAFQLFLSFGSVAVLSSMQDRAEMTEMNFFSSVVDKNEKYCII